MDEYQARTNQNKPDTKDYISYESIYIKLLKRQN